MRATIDGAGRLTIPKELRDRLGLVRGEVEIGADGTDLRVRPIIADALVTRDRRALGTYRALDVDVVLIG